MCLFGDRLAAVYLETRIDDVAEYWTVEIEGRCVSLFKRKGVECRVWKTRFDFGIDEPDTSLLTLIYIGEYLNMPHYFCNITEIPLTNNTRTYFLILLVLVS